MAWEFKFPHRPDVDILSYVVSLFSAILILYLDTGRVEGIRHLVVP